MKKILFLFLAAALLYGCTPNPPGLLLLVGTYTDTDSQGIYSFSMNGNTPEAGLVAVTPAVNPSFLCYNPDSQTVYAVNEQMRDASVSAYSLDPATGLLTLKNSRPALGSDPCHVTCIGGTVITANYSSGSFTFYPVNEDGRIGEGRAIQFCGCGPDTLRQRSSHIHSSSLSPDGNFLFIADLGADCLYRIPVKEGRIDGHTLSKMEMAPGSGPRHFTFSGDGRFLYVLGELGGDIAVYGYDDGELTPVQTLVADTLHASGSADIHISPDGRFLYASHRLKGDGISIFSRNAETGLLERVGYQATGVHPRNFAITPDGRYLLAACRDSDVIQVFERDEKTGLLTDTGMDIDVPHPVMVKIIAER